MSIPVPGQGTLIINRQVKHVKLLGATGAINVLRFVGDGPIEMIGRAFSRNDGQIGGGLTDDTVVNLARAKLQIKQG